MQPIRALRPFWLACLFVSTACSIGADVPRSQTPSTQSDAAPQLLIERYLERYFQTFPSRATAAGRHDLDTALEDLDASERASWSAFNRDTADRLRELLAQPALGDDDRIDLALLLRQAERQYLSFGIERRPEHDPLFWTGIAANANLYLLVRDDHPRLARLESAAARARQLPRLLDQAKVALASAPTNRIAAELCAMASRQAKSTATFYRQGLARAARDGDPAALRKALHSAGTRAAEALDAFAGFLEQLEAKAGGDPKLGNEVYASRFRLITGDPRPVAEVLAIAKKALRAKRSEAAAYGRDVWTSVLPGTTAPEDDALLLRTLFARVSEDRAEDTDAFVAHYRTLIEDVVAFVEAHDVLTLPKPLTVHMDRSPSYFVGQSVGGVYPAGPYSPEADTLFYLPTPSDSATSEARDAFFRDFNHHFNVMITPHELVPGHYLQLKRAAMHPRIVRALFGDGVAIEGWGTFCERLMLDLGWGGPLARLAHLKKQLENISRTIVDIQVHTTDMDRDAVVRFVQDEALQDRQFAENMWRRTITSAPQLTFYFLGYRQVDGLYQAARAKQGERFVLKTFMDALLALGPMPIADAHERLLGD